MIHKKLDCPKNSLDMSLIQAARRKLARMWRTTVNASWVGVGALRTSCNTCGSLNPKSYNTTFGLNASIIRGLPPIDPTGW